MNAYLPTSEGWIAELVGGLFVVLRMGFEPKRVDPIRFETHCTLTSWPHHHEVQTMASTLTGQKLRKMTSSTNLRSGSVWTDKLFEMINQEF